MWFDGRGIHLTEPLLLLRGVFTGVPVEVETKGAAGERTVLRDHDFRG